MVISYTDDSINLLVRSSNQSTVRRYCVELAKLPNGHTVNITGFGWHFPYLASPSVNVEKLFRKNISLMILTNRTDTSYALTYNTTTMPVSIPVLIFWQNDFNKINKTYNNIELSIDYPLDMPKKFRPAVLLMFLLVLFILLCGNFWAADEFLRKIKNRNGNFQSESTSLNTSPIINDFRESNNIQNETIMPKENNNTHIENRTPRNNEPAIIYMPYFIIALILCFAVGWLLLIYYFPKVMIYILQGNVQNIRI
jgi:hypothetical protein